MKSLENLAPAGTTVVQDFVADMRIHDVDGVLVGIEPVARRIHFIPRLLVRAIIGVLESSKAIELGLSLQDPQWSS